MRYHVLATDFDGTLAHDEIVLPSTMDSLKRFVASGRHVVLVTGRELPDLKAVFPDLSLFCWVVAENGGLLYEPSSTKELVLGPSASEKLVSALRSSGVMPLSVGKSVIATWSPFEQTVTRHRLSIGVSPEGEVGLSSYSGPVLICGPSGSGKSTLSNRIVDSIVEQNYQFCLVDPEGDYESFEGAVVLGSPNSAPLVDEALHVLEQPDANLVLCLTGVAIPERPTFFLQLLLGARPISPSTVICDCRLQ